MTPSTTRMPIRAELVDRVLPWWQRHAVDAEYGGVHTMFDNAGRQTGTDKYTWSQGRWAWLCARLAQDARSGLLDVDPVEWSTYALDTARFLSRCAVLPGAVTAHLLTRDGRPLSPGGRGPVSVSVLSDLFTALGLVGASALLPDTDAERRHWLSQARALLEHATSRLAARTAPSEPYPVPTGFRDLAGVMLRLHVAAELHTVDQGDDSALAATRAAADLVTGPTAMWGQDDWWEFRPDDPENHDSLLARHRTPGHLLETAWMLLHAARTIDPVAALVPDWLPQLVHRGFELGWDDGQGGLFRYVDRGGGQPRGRHLSNGPYETLVADTWDTKLWWVHAEAMLAASTFHAAYPQSGFDGWHRKVSDYTMATFPDPAGQEWLQIRDRGGRPLDRVVALPVKDPFHIARSLLLSLELETG